MNSSSKRKNTYALKGSVSAIAILGVMVATDASAQYDEIIVTTRKRTENLQDVPVSVQTFDTEEIARKGLTDFQDYSKYLTSVSFGSTSPGATTIVFRGASSNPSGFDTVSSSTLYLDEIPITRDGQNPDVRLIDIERLEALAGPQPTIYGAGSQSGTLKIVTNKPNTSEFSGFVDLGGGTTHKGSESFDVAAMLNIPLVEDKLAIRLVGFYEEEGGYIDNVLGTTSVYSASSGTRTNAGVVEEDHNSATSSGARAQVRLNVNEDWTVTAGVTYQDTELDGLFDFNSSVGDLQTVKFKDESRNDDWYNVALTVEGDLGWANLVSATGFHRRNIQYDFDGTQYATLSRDAYASYTGPCPSYGTYNCYYNLWGFGPDPTALIHLDQRVQSFVQEIRLSSKDDTDSRFGWLLGAFYEKKSNDWEYTQNIDDLATAPLAATFFAYYSLAPTTTFFETDFYRQDNEQIAVFGELSYDLTDRLTVTGGGRWFRDEQRILYQSTFPAGRILDQYDISAITSDFASSVSLTYQVQDNFMTYFTRSEGARIGGANNLRPMSVSPRLYDPDKLINYEAGVKSTWWDGRILANVSAFMMNWRDFQLQTTDPAAGGFVVLNIGNASINGVEGTFAIKPTKGLELTSGVTYIDAQADETVVVGGITVVAAGDRLPVTPNWKYTASAQYTHEFGSDYEGYIRFDFSHVGQSVNGIPGSLANFNVGASTIQTQPAYQIGNIGVGIAAQDWELSLAINNLWDERAIEYIHPRFADNRIITNRPREIRMGLRKSF